ncbi:MAG: transketolase [Candidatus Eisenbacteria bacterium]|nr:transketolase [Candidatus Eisenbacteria bacterium]
MSQASPNPVVPADPSLEQRCVNALRFLAVDGVEAARSGHPGMPMGAADMAFVLWSEFLRHDPQAADWPDRDRFVLSAGHGSMLIYSLLHLFGYPVTLQDLRNFRQWGSRTPGHPERGHTVGVETTTGPLGQGFAHGVGMALASKMLGARFNRPDFAPFTHRVFGIVSDGDLMEGVSSEAASLAGHWGLGNLVYLYDRNHISIEGDTSLAFGEDVAVRFLAFGWQVLRVDGHDRAGVRGALASAVADTSRPSLIVARTHIGYGSPGKQDSHEAHGAPLGPEETKRAKANLGWPEEPPFHVPADVRAFFAGRARDGGTRRERWQEGLGRWAGAHPDLAEGLAAHLQLRVPADLDARLVEGMDQDAATRQHSQAVIQKISAEVPALVGGSADLDPSTLTWIRGSTAVGLGEGEARFAGRCFHFGIREHAMGAIVNGLALGGAFLPYGSSFLVFTDYARPAIRLSALMKVRSTWVFTHDSIFLGEDGPTHQPVEHLASLRAMPGLRVWRPADGLETAMSWAWCMQRADGPNLLALSRQKTGVLRRPEGFDRRDVWRGGYVARRERGPRPDAVIVATGSEVSLAVQAAERLAGPAAQAPAGGTAGGGPAAGPLDVRVVSMPCVENWREQDAAWRDSVLPPGIPRVSLEAAVTFGWSEVLGAGSLCLGLDRFGASAPLADLQQHFGFTPQLVAERIRAFVATVAPGPGR